MKGKVKKVIPQRGFGFIAAEDGKEVFFHCSAMEGESFDTLEEGADVEFELEKGPKGLRAVKIRIVKS